MPTATILDSADTGSSLNHGKLWGIALRSLPASSLVPRKGCTCQALIPSPSKPCTPSWLRMKPALGYWIPNAPFNIQIMQKLSFPF